MGSESAGTALKLALLRALCQGLLGLCACAVGWGQTFSEHRIRVILVQERAPALADSARLGPFRPLLGAYYEEALLQSALRELLRRYAASGYRARVFVEALEPGPDSTLSIRIGVEPGPLLRVQQVSWEGLSRRERKPLDSALDSLLGAPFTERWRANLLRLLDAHGYAASPQIRLALDSADVRLRVRPRRASGGRLDGWLGWGTTQGWMGRLELGLDGLGGGPRSAALYLERWAGMRLRASARYEEHSLLGSDLLGYAEARLAQQDSSWRRWELEVGLGYEGKPYGGGLVARWGDLGESSPAGFWERRGWWAGAWGVFNARNRTLVRLRGLVGRWREAKSLLSWPRALLELWAQAQGLEYAPWRLILKGAAGGIWGRELRPAERFALGGARSLPGYPEEAYRAARYGWSRLELQIALRPEAYAFGLLHGVLLGEDPAGPVRRFASWGVGLLYPAVGGQLELLYAVAWGRSPDQGFVHVGYRLRW
ncbi:MAG: hypothetical protein RMK61_06795 [Bacteroidota bacterium]|nr:hypothetical protein [Bacteroidota bacterium]